MPVSLATDRSAAAGTPDRREKRRVTRLRLVVPLIPLFLLILLVAWNYGKSPLAVQLYWNDEISHWHQARSFGVAGFDSGYFAVDERPAPATFTPFSVHGPWYPMLAGSIARVFGWSVSSGVVLNTALVTLALYAFVISTLTTSRQLLALAFVLATAYPMIFYLPINMHEGMQQSFAILLAIGFSRVLTLQERLPLFMKIGIGVFLMGVSLTRLSWALLLAPFFVLVNGKTPRGLLLAAIQSSISSTLVYLVVFATTAPGNHSVFRATAALGTSAGSVRSLLQQAWRSARVYGDLTGPNRLDATQKSGVILLMAFLAILAGRSLLRRMGRGGTSAPVDSPAIFNFFNLAAVHGAAFAFYIIGTWGDYRVIYAHILLSLLLLIGAGRLTPVVLFVVTSLWALPTLNQSFRGFTEAKYMSAPVDQEARIQMVRAVRYERGAPSRWCNTLLMDIGLYDGLVTTIPAGVGTSVIFRAKALSNIRSRYLWVTDATYAELTRRVPQTSLRYMFSMPAGKVYLNLRGECPEPASSSPAR